MKDKFKHIKLAEVCAWFGISRQAYYEHMWEVETTSQKEALIIEQVKKIRDGHPSMGRRKLHLKLQNFIELHRFF